MQTADAQISNVQSSSPIHWGHFGNIILVIILLGGITFMKKPGMFSLKKPVSAVAVNAPQYYAYVQAEANATPLVAGANTNQGPSIINEDGTISPVDMGEVLGASIQNVQLVLADIKVKTVPDSAEAIEKYLSDSQWIKNGAIENSAFETALSSVNQNIINTQAEKLISVRESLQNIPVPTGLVKYHQLTILQYNASVGLLQNFTQADINPELVGQYLNLFLKSQQDLDNETAEVAKKYNLEPSALGSVAPGN